MKNLHFLLKNIRFLLKNLRFLLKNIRCLLKNLRLLLKNLRFLLKNLTLPRLSVPDPRSFVEGSCDDFVAERVVERDRVHDIFVAFEGQQLLACVGVPHLAGAVVRSRDKAVAALVERTWSPQIINFQRSESSFSVQES